MRNWVGLFRSMLIAASLTSSLLVNQEDASKKFIDQNREALQQNPSGLKIELLTPVNQTTFHLYETIPLEIAYSSSQPRSYTIETNETMNVSGQTDWFTIEPVDAVIRTGRMWAPITFSCCDGRLVDLTPKPIVLQRELTDYVRFGKPGQYLIYFSTRRVFLGKGDVHDRQVKVSDFRTTSNILAITVLPDDPDWDARQLARTLRQLRDPGLAAEYQRKQSMNLKDSSEAESDVAKKKELSQDEYARAQKQLNALDTENAIRERVHRMKIETISDWRQNRRLDLRSSFYQTYLASSTRPDLIVAAMKARSSDSTFGVDYDYAIHWAAFLVQNDHPDIFKMLPAESNQQDDWHRFNTAEALEAKAQIVSDLESVLGAKSGTAKEMTADTIKALKDDTARWKAPSGTSTK